jgi:DNA-binding MarR family transcriptional regulator
MAKTKETIVLQLYPLIRQVLNRVGTHRTITGAGFNLTSLQTEALSVVEKNNNLTMGEFAQDILIVQSSATRIADELVRRGLLTRSEDHDDRRVNRLQISPGGQLALEKVRSESQYLLKKVLERMSSGEQKALIDGLQAFVNAVTEVEKESTKE